MPRETFTAIAVALAAVLASAPARADDAAKPPRDAIAGPVVVSAHLELVRGPGAERCPPEQKLHDEVARRLGYDPFAPNVGGRPMGRVRTTLTRSPRGLTATTELVDPEGVSQWVRTYTVRGTSARDCELATVGAAVEIAAELTLFDEPPPAPPVPAPAPVALAPPPTPAPPVAEPPPPAPPPSPRPAHPHFEVGAGFAVVFGTSPGVAMSGTVHAGVQIFPFAAGAPSLSFAAEFRGDAPVASATALGVGGRASLLSGSILVCVHKRLIARATITGSLFGCTVGAAGVARTTFSGAFHRQVPVGLPYAGLGVRPGIEAGIGPRLALRLHLEALGDLLPSEVETAGEPSGTNRLSLDAGLSGVLLF